MTRREADVSGRSALGGRLGDFSAFPSPSAYDVSEPRKQIVREFHMLKCCSGTRRQRSHTSAYAVGHVRNRAHDRKPSAGPVFDCLGRDARRYRDQERSIPQLAGYVAHNALHLRRLDTQRDHIGHNSEFAIIPEHRHVRKKEAPCLQELLCGRQTLSECSSLPAKNHA